MDAWIPGSETVDELIAALRAAPVHHFAEWDLTEVPNDQPGVYAIWEGSRFLYIGIAGRALTGLPTPEHGAVGRRGLLGRLHSHASGRRSGDQFCIYLFDRLILPELTPAQIESAAAGRLSLDGVVRELVRTRLSYRYLLVPDYKTAGAIERRIQRDGLDGDLPLLNPARTAGIG